MKARLIRRLLVVLLGVMLTACDPPTGVTRTLRLKVPPTRASVEAALRDVPEIKRIQLVAESGAGDYSINYFLANDGGVIEVRQVSKDAFTLEMKRLAIGTTPKDQADHIRAVMDRIYASLRKYAPELPPSTNVVEKLIRVVNNSGSQNSIHHPIERMLEISAQPLAHAGWPDSLTTRLGLFGL